MDAIGQPANEHELILEAVKRCHPCSDGEQVSLYGVFEWFAGKLEAASAPAPATTPEELAQKFHETYERLAPKFGYKTREASAKPWNEVPANNRELMTAVCAEILSRLEHCPASVPPELLQSIYAHILTRIDMISGDAHLVAELSSLLAEIKWMARESVPPSPPSPPVTAPTTIASGMVWYEDNVLKRTHTIELASGRESAGQEQNTAGMSTGPTSQHSSPVDSYQTPSLSNEPLASPPSPEPLSYDPEGFNADIRAQLRKQSGPEPRKETK